MALNSTSIAAFSRYVPAEAVPVRYGGLKRDDDTEFSAEDGGVSEVIVKSNSTETLEIPAPEVTLFVAVLMDRISRADNIVLNRVGRRSTGT